MKIVLKFDRNLNETQIYLYDNYGSIFDSYDSTQVNPSWLSKTKDLENNLAVHGVRKYDNFAHRFTSCDALWEKHISWNPYQYCMGDPVIKVGVKI